MSLHYGIPVRRLQTEIDSREFSELLARHLYIEPIGQPWKQTAQLCAAVIGLFSKDVKPDDFLPILRMKSEPEGLSIWKQFVSYAKQHNAKAS